MQRVAGRLRDCWRDASLADAGWLLLFAGLFYASKWAGKVIDGVPGHSCLFWVPVLLLSRELVARPGASTVTAFMGAVLWCFPKGGGAVALAPYVAAGIALDMLGAREGRLRSLPFALIAGAICHLAKFGFHNVPRAVIGGPADFMVWGLWNVALLHVLFGLGGGLVGWGLLRLREREAR
jgi:hypothetical protein